MIEINTYDYETILVVELSGHLNSQASSDIQKWFEDQIKQNSIYIAVDFTGIQYVSSMGISAFIKLNSLIKDTQGCLVLFNINFEITRLFHFLKFNEKITISSSVEDAINILLKYKEKYFMAKEIKIIANESLKKLSSEAGDALILEEELKGNTINIKDDKNKINNSIKKKRVAIIDKPSKEIKNEIIVRKTQIISCPNCKKYMKIKTGTQFMCPHCKNGIILI